MATSSKNLPTFSLKHFNRGEVSDKDLDSLDSPVDCLLETNNVEINNPTGVLSRSFGYYPSESNFPSPAQCVLKYFIRFSIDKPTPQQLLALFFRESPSGLFRIYINPNGVWVELTEFEVIGATTINDDYLEFSKADVSLKYYENWIIHNNTKNQYALVRAHTNPSGNIQRLSTVEKLLSNGYSWLASDDYILYRSPLKAFFNSSLSDITAFDFLELFGRLRIATGVGVNAVAQWIGYLDNKIAAYLPSGADRSIQMANFHLEPLNSGIKNAFDVSFTADKPKKLQFAITAVDIEGQEVVVVKRTKTDAPMILGNDNTFVFNLLISAPILSKRFSQYNVYANDDENANIFFLQSLSSITQKGIPKEDITVGNWQPVPLYQRINSPEPNESTPVYSTVKPSNSDYFEVKLSSVVDPLTGNGHSYTYIFAAMNGGTDFGFGGFRVDLYQGNTVIHAGVTNPFSVDPLGETLHFTIKENLTQAEADSITDYSNLRLRFYPVGIIGDFVSLLVFWAQFNTPTNPSSVAILNSNNRLQITFSGTYSESGRLLYYSPEISSDAKFKAIKYHKGRVYILGEDEDFVRFTQFNTNGAETHDYFPFDKDSSFGYFIVSAGSAEKNTALAESKDRNLIILKGKSTYVYTVSEGRGFASRLSSLFSGSGALSQNAVDDRNDSGLFFANYTGIYLYVGGIQEPVNLLSGRLAKFYLSLPNSYKDNILLKFNRQTNELWVLLQITGVAGSSIASDYRIFVYSMTFNNWRRLQPYHLVTFLSNDRQDLVLEVSANNKVQMWDFGASAVFTHDGQVPPEPYVVTHKISNNIVQLEQADEIYAEYDSQANFTIEFLLGEMTTPLPQNSKLFNFDGIRRFVGVRNGFAYNKFGFRIKFGNTAVKQQIKEFGVTYYPLGGLYDSRKTK